MFCTAACSSDVDIAPAPETESEVSFTVELPGDLQSRTFNDGYSARNLWVAVYNADGGELADLRQVTTFAAGQLTKTINMRLANSRTYTVVFWAFAEGAPYTFDRPSHTMTVDYSSIAANSDKYDAFYKAITITNVSGSVNQTVELRRPFAQLNIGATDKAQAANAGWDTQTTSVTVSEVFTTLDFFSGEVSIPRSYTYTLAPKPDSDDETFPVAGADYQAMVYVLTGADQSLVNVDFTAVDNTTITRNYQNVPIRRNYQTNIYGNILTEEANFNVEIIPEFDGWYNSPNDGVYINEAGEYEISTKAGLVWVANEVNSGRNSFAGKVIKQIADIDLEGDYEGGTRLRTAIGWYSNKPFEGTFDGNGFRILNLVQVMNPTGLFRYIGNGAVLKNITLYTIDLRGYTEGGGLVAYTFPGGNTLIDNCVVENGRMESLAIPWQGWYGRQLGGIVAKLESGNEVRNCTVRNLTISAHTEIGGIAGYSNGTITGCTVENTTVKRDNNNFFQLADDYSIIHEFVGKSGESASATNNTATNVTVINDPVARETLVIDTDTSIGTGYTFWCTNGEGAYGSAKVGLTIKNNAVVDANNHTFVFKNADQQWDADIHIISGTLKNVTISGCWRAMFLNGLTDNVYLDNVTLDATTYGFHADYGFDKDLIVTNSTIKGFCTYCTGAGEVQFTDCIFAKSSAGYAVMNIRKNTTFTRCNFQDGFNIGVIESVTPLPTVILKNCYAGETLITPDNFEELLGDSPTLVTIIND